MCCAFLLHLLCLVCAFLLHFLCVFCICLVDKCVFSHVFCVCLHSKASFGDLFLRFLCIFVGIGFALFFALFMHFCVLLCHQN